jgi:hypothetical protein
MPSVSSHVFIASSTLELNITRPEEHDRDHAPRVPAMHLGCEYAMLALDDDDVLLAGSAPQHHITDAEIM